MLFSLCLFPGQHCVFPVHKAGRQIRLTEKVRVSLGSSGGQVDHLPTRKSLSQADEEKEALATAAAAKKAQEWRTDRFRFQRSIHNGCGVE